jgi:hypothetical protein
MKKMLLVALVLASSAVLAHDGHGLIGPHWHATDMLGFVVAGAAGALAWWASRK